MKFALGQVYLTRGVNEKLGSDEVFAKFVSDCLGRHAEGDWGDLCAEDKEENELSIKEGFRLLSAYQYQDQKIWIITEADRSATTVLFPDEY